MARFNTESKTKSVRKAGGDTVNLAGGQAFSLAQKEELVSIMLTSFLQDQFYRSGGDTLNRIVELVERVDKEFAAKAAVYARNVFGMRSVSHVVAGEIARLVKGEQWTAPFFNSVVFRPDDMYEIMAYFGARYGQEKVRPRNKGNHEERKVVRAIPNALKKGFRQAIGRFDSYQLAKYRGEGKEFTLVDLVNILRPTATDRNAEALEMLMKGNLRSTDTWESMLTRAGQQAENAEDLANLKANAWKELILTRKLGYFALLRNLRNIMQQAPDVVKAAAAMLVEENLIRKSKVLPFRYYTAYNEIEGSASRDILAAISKALDIACSNVPELDGKTLIVLDDSGSMTSGSVNGQRARGMTPATIGALLSSVMLRRNVNADFMMFNDSARYVHIPVDGGVISNIKWITSKFKSAGTNFHSIFNAANKAYDRIVIMSDMQGWVGHYSPSGHGGTFDKYKSKYKCDPFIYSIDLQGYGTSQFNPMAQKIFMLSGFSEKIFDIMKLLETDKRAMISEIEKVQFAA